jgi:hypothetical protein
MRLCSNGCFTRVAVAMVQLPYTWSCAHILVQQCQLITEHATCVVPVHLPSPQTWRDHRCQPTARPTSYALRAEYLIKWEGCYASMELLAPYPGDSAMMTQIRCMELAAADQRKYAVVRAMDGDTWCFGSNTITSVRSPVACSPPCLGGPNENCGNGYATFQVTPIYTNSPISPPGIP